MKKTTRKQNQLALLGKTPNGDKVYLERAEYACDWYFSFGNIVIFEKNKSRPSIHTHWNSYFTGSKHVEPEEVKLKIPETTLTEEELWILCDLMNTFYTLKEASGIYNRTGSSHLSGKTRGRLNNHAEAKKHRTDVDTYKIIVDIQKTVGLDAPREVDNLPTQIKPETGESDEQ